MSKDKHPAPQRERKNPQHTQSSNNRMQQGSNDAGLDGSNDGRRSSDDFRGGNQHKG